MFPTDDLTITTLSAAMRGLGLRHTALAQNVANADTPGYRRVDVQFEGALAEAVAADREGAAPGGREGMRRAPASATGQVDAEVGSGGAAMRVDGGTVDADQEMAALAANQLAYQTVTALLSKKFGQLAYVINGR